MVALRSSSPNARSRTRCCVVNRVVASMERAISFASAFAAPRIACHIIVFASVALVIMLAPVHGVSFPNVPNERHCEDSVFSTLSTPFVLSERGALPISEWARLCAGAKSEEGASTWSGTGGAPSAAASSKGDARSPMAVGSAANGEPTLAAPSKQVGRRPSRADAAGRIAAAGGTHPNSKMPVFSQ